ncbi:MAG: sigma factor [bacterium]
MSENTNINEKSESNEDFLLIEDFKKGNKTAFNRLVLKYRDQIMNVCVRFLGDYSQGEDAAQDTFVKAYNGLAGFKEEASFTTLALLNRT